jgi:drug/metabolite transporter (DMT)-like permease
VTSTWLATVHHAHGLARALGLPGRFAEHLRERLGRAYIPAIVIVESVIGAGLYALSSVLEQRAASEEPHERSLRLNLLVGLARRRLWLLGMAAGVAGYAMQFIALRKGSLALVQPIFVAGLVMALVGSALARHRRLSRREWLANAQILGGIALYIAAAQPGPGHPRGSTLGWILLATFSTTAVAALIAFSRGSPQRRSLALGAATGIVLGVSSAITERTSHRLGISLGYTLSDWSPYVLVVVSIGGLVLNQSAFQAGELQWSLPAITVLEPLVAILVGQALFHEHVATSALHVAGQILGLASMVAGVLVLATSPALDGLVVATGGPDAAVG